MTQQEVIDLTSDNSDSEADEQQAPMDQLPEHVSAAMPQQDMQDPNPQYNPTQQPVQRQQAPQIALHPAQVPAWAAANTAAARIPDSPVSLQEMYAQLHVKVKQESPRGPAQQAQHTQQQLLNSTARKQQGSAARAVFSAASAATAASAGGPARQEAAAAQEPPAKRLRAAGYPQHKPPAGIAAGSPGSTGMLERVLQHAAVGGQHPLSAQLNAHAAAHAHATAAVAGQPPQPLQGAAAAGSGAGEGTGEQQLVQQPPRTKDRVGSKLGNGGHGRAGVPAAAQALRAGQPRLAAAAAGGTIRTTATAAAGGAQDSGDFGHYTALQAAATAAATAAVSAAGEASCAAAGAVGEEDEVSGSIAAGQHNSAAASTPAPAAQPAPAGAAAVIPGMEQAALAAMIVNAAASVGGLGGAGMQLQQQPWQQLAGNHQQQQQLLLLSLLQQQQLFQRQLQQQQLLGLQAMQQQQQHQYQQQSSQQVVMQQQASQPAGPSIPGLGGYSVMQQQLGCVASADLPPPAAADPPADASDQDAIDLNEQYQVWPPLDASDENDQSPDLISTSCMQPGARLFMQRLVEMTQPRSASVRAQAERAIKEHRKEEARKQLLGGEGYVKGEPDDRERCGTGRGSVRRGRGGKGLRGGGRGRGRGAFGARAGSSEQAAYAAAAAAGGVRDSPIAAAAAAWTAARAQPLYTWQDAPSGNFYKVDLVDVNDKICAVLTQEDIIDKERWQEELDRISRLTRVEVVTDPCHPCLHNPVRPATMPPSRHLMLTARANLPANSLVSLYFGDVTSMREDNSLNFADLTCHHGLKHAYLMTVEVSKEVYIPEADGEAGEVMIAGDQKHCRSALINDVKYWEDEMEDRGWGLCPRHVRDPTTCNCNRYRARNEEDYAAFINVEWRHFMYKTKSGEFVPAIGAYTNKDVPECMELYTTYEKGSKGFWKAIQSNLALACYVDSLDKRGQDMRAAMEQVLARIRQAGGAGLNPQMEQICLQALRADDKHQQDQRVLMQEARALHLGEPIPPEVAETRRRTVAAAAAAVTAAAERGMQGLL